jgi:cell wall-associated NlpC family hydrolase
MPHALNRAAGPRIAGRPAPAAWPAAWLIARFAPWFAPWFTPFIAAILLGACSIAPQRNTELSEPLPISQAGNEVAIYALDMIDTGYRFGGKNPEAGLDCSGMVSYVYRKAAGINLNGSAADIAKHGKEIDRRLLRPGDLVFFNTEHKPFSHVAIYIGDNRFVHAPSTNGKVRIDRLDNRYYSERFEIARSYLP